MSPDSERASGLGAASALVTAICTGLCHSRCHSQAPFRPRRTAHDDFDHPPPTPDRPGIWANAPPQIEHVALPTRLRGLADRRHRRMGPSCPNPRGATRHCSSRVKLRSG